MASTHYGRYDEFDHQAERKKRQADAAAILERKRLDELAERARANGLKAEPGSRAFELCRQTAIKMLENAGSRPIGNACTLTSRRHQTEQFHMEQDQAWNDADRAFWTRVVNSYTEREMEVHT